MTTLKEETLSRLIISRIKDNNYIFVRFIELKIIVYKYVYDGWIDGKIDSNRRRYLVFTQYVFSKLETM